MEMNFEIITLKWEEKFWDGKLVNNFTDTGIYQIYGDSPVYGRNILLYIGKATNVDTRLFSHINSTESFIGRQPNKSCRYAKVDEPLLDIVEQILIVMHKPSFNSNHIIDISAKAKEKPYMIHNHGERGSLNLEVSNFYFVNK